MDVHQFTRSVQRLLREDVAGLSGDAQREILQRQLELLDERALREYQLAFVPFVPGRRPADEIVAPGLGSSEPLGLLHGSTKDEIIFLFRTTRAGRPAHELPAGSRLLATLRLLDASGRPTDTLPGWDAREIAPARLGELVGDGEGADARAHAEQAWAIRIDVDSTFGPLKESLLGPAAPFGFGSLFFERFRLDLALDVGGATVAGDAFEFEIFDETGFGALYSRISGSLLPDDLRRQLAAEGRSDVGVAYHPWFPVLCIGVEKANLYMKAVRGDVARETCMLTDPAWVLRVGLYLELLTCLGIVEVARSQLDLLSPEERQIFETSPRFAALRARIDTRAWSEVWRLRGISFLRTPGIDMPVGFQNLLKKKAATLGFLHAHHEDLKQAIAFAGPNRTNAQETWQRVFRDAERAVLKMNEDAFPELAYLSEPLRRFVLWHRKGAFGLSIASSVAAAFGDQDGLFPSACSQYRASMNHVAEWAAERGLMEYTGSECVPRTVSLLESHITGDHARLRQLQQRDGYRGALEACESDEGPRRLSMEEIHARLARVAVFSVLTKQELEQLARRARTITLGPTERILVQGNAGSSLFVLHEGQLEVIVKTDDRERTHGRLAPGAVVGEIAFLTGEARTATVRALDAAVVIELGARHLEPLVRERPAILDELTALMERRQEREGDPLPSEGLLQRFRRERSALSTVPPDPAAQTAPLRVGHDRASVLRALISAAIFGR